MQPRARYAAILVSLGILACLGDPVGPSTLMVSLQGASADTVWAGAPGEAMPRVVRLRISDDGGHPIAAASIVWESDGVNSHVTSAATRSDSRGDAGATWILGTNAAEQQTLHVTVQTNHHESTLLLRARAVPQVVSQLHVVADTPAVLRVGDTLQLRVDASDPYGNVFPAPDVAAVIDDSTIGVAAGVAVVGGPRRGPAIVRVTSRGIATTVPLRVTQYVAAILPTPDTLALSSLRAGLPVLYEVRDDRGRIVHDTTPDLSVSDTAIVRLTGAQLRSVALGAATVHLALGAANADVAAVINQRIASLRLVRDTIRFDALRDTTTLDPIASDSLGAVVHQPTVVVQVLDDHIAQVDGSGTLRSLSPGSTIVTVRDPVTGVSTSAPVVVQQRVAQVVLAKDSLVIESLNAEQLLAGTALDPLGSAVAGAPIAYSVEDTTVARVDQAGRIHAGANGSTRFIATAKGSTGSAPTPVSPPAVRGLEAWATNRLSAR